VCKKKGNKKMTSKKLDLHGIRHHEVDILVENFVYENQNYTPLIIVCGNSAEMIRLVEEKLNAIGSIHNQSRYGIIMITKV